MSRVRTMSKNQTVDDTACCPANAEREGLVDQRAGLLRVAANQH